MNADLPSSADPIVGLRTQRLWVMAQNSPALHASSCHEIVASPGMISSAIRIGIEAATKITPHDEHRAVPETLVLKFQHKVLDGVVRALEQIRHSIALVVVVSGLLQYVRLPVHLSEVA